MTNELKPCPFCGGEAEIASDYREGIGNTYVPMCRNGCSTPVYVSKSEEEAIAAWNRRTVDVDELEQSLEESSKHVDANMSVFEKAIWLTSAIFAAVTLLILFIWMLVSSLVDIGVL